MPITKSAIKQMKQAEKSREHNREVKAKFRNKVKAVHKDLASGGKNVATLASDAFSALDKAAKKNVIHKRTAARRKSRLMAAIQKAGVKTVELKSTKVKQEKPKTTMKKSTNKATTTKKTTKKAS